MHVSMTVWGTEGEENGTIELLGALSPTEDCVECVLEFQGKKVRFLVNAEDLENAMRTLRAFTAHQ